MARRSGGIVQLPDSQLSINANSPTYGAVPDGVIASGGTVTGTDNLPKIQAALDAAKAAGGGDVCIYQPGVYYLQSSGSGNGLVWHLLISGDHVHLRMAPGVILASTTNAMPIALTGYAKTHAMSSWNTLAYFAAKTNYPMNAPVAKGATSITLTTPGDAANFAVGDAIMIRTGQLVSISGGYPDGTPDMEPNEVASSNSSTGVIGLRWPTVKEYHQEYHYPTGNHANKSFRAPVDLSDPAPCGLVNVEDSCVRDIGVHGGQIWQRGAVNWHAIMRYQCIDYTIEDVTVGSVDGIYSDCGAWAGSSCRFGKIRNIRNDAKANAVHNAFSVGDCSSRFVDVEVSAIGGIATLEISEGIADIQGDIKLRSDDTYAGTDVRGVSGGLRCRDMDITVEMVNHMAGLGIWLLQDSDIPAAEQSGNTLRPRLVGNFATISAKIEGPGWRIVEERGSTTNPIVVPASDHSPQQPVERFTLEGAVLFSDANVNIPLGTLPKYSWLESVEVYVYGNFNAGGTNLLDIGWVGATQGIVLALDVSSLGAKAPPAAFVGYENAERPIVVTYRYSGAAPTVGEALVVLHYAKTNILPTA